MRQGVDQETEQGIPTNQELQEAEVEEVNVDLEIENPPENPAAKAGREKIESAEQVSREGHFEVQGLARAAESFKQFGERAPEHMADVIEQKKCFNFKKTEGDRPAETIARELQEIEDLIGGLQGELENSGLPPEQIQEGMMSIREVLYTIVTKEIISGGKIKEIVGGIHFQDKPDTTQGGEAFGERTDTSKIKGMTVLNEQTGKFDIYFYSGFFRGTEKGRSHVARHEFSHVLAEGTNMFDPEVYNKFIACAGDPNITEEQISEIAAQAPELAEILKIMQNPESNRELWNGYIKSRIDKLSSLQGEDLIDEREAVASELVAEMIVPYLESGEDEIGYISRRFESCDQDQLLNFLITSAKKPDGSPCQTGEDFVSFCAARGVQIDIDNASPIEIVAAVSGIPEFSATFGAGHKFFDKLKGAFDEKGANLQPTQAQYFHQEEELGDFDSLMDYSEYFDEYYGYEGGEGGKAPRQRGAKPQQSALAKFWDFLFARNQPANSVNATTQGVAKGGLAK